MKFRSHKFNITPKDGKQGQLKSFFFHVKERKIVRMSKQSSFMPDNSQVNMPNCLTVISNGFSEAEDTKSAKMFVFEQKCSLK